MGLRFRNRNLPVDAQWSAQPLEGHLYVFAILTKPAGNLAITVPAPALPITADLDIECGAESMFVIGGEPWTVTRVTVNAMRLEDEALSAQLTLGLSNDLGASEELAVLTIKDETISIGAKVAAKPKTAPRRRDTFDLAVGFGRMRWSDWREDVEGSVYASTWRAKGAGKDMAGRPVNWGPGLEIPGFIGIPRRGEYLWFSAFVSFGKSKVVSGLTLHPWRESERRETPTMVAWLGKKLKLKPLTEASAQAWHVGAVRVELERAVDRFLFTLERST